MESCEILSDGLGGAIITWQDYRSGNWDIYAHRFVISRPTEFLGLAVSTTTIIWSWIDNSPNEDGFYIFRSTSGIVGTVSSNTTYWIETNLLPNTQYVRYIRAYNTIGFSDPSNLNSKYTLAKSPTGLLAVGVYLSSVTLRWDDVGATRYAIERSTGIDEPVNWQVIKQWSDNITRTSYTDTELLSETTYWYRIRSYNAEIRLSDPSNVVVVITLPLAASSIYGEAKSSSSILWQWTDNSNCELGFRVKTATGGVITELTSDTTFWLESNLEPNTQYTRYVVAYNALQENHQHQIQHLVIL